MTDCPPVLFTCWCRPALARQVFARIRAARPARLYFAVDGINDDHDSAAWHEVRGLAGEVDWECLVQCRFLEKNAGCRHGLEGAISWFFEHEEEGIILEEDCVPDMSFFDYCREALERYRTDEQVMVISGTNLFTAILPESRCRFSTSNQPWGWASWRRAWQSHDTRVVAPAVDWGDPAIRDWLGSAVALRLWRHRQTACLKNWVESWDFPWQLHIINKRGLYLIPAVNLIRNIGCGDISTHTTKSNSLVESTPAICHPLPVVFPADIVQDPDYMALFVRSEMREFTKPAESLAEATLDMMQCRSPVKDIRGIARQLTKLMHSQNREKTSHRRGLAGWWRKCIAGNSTKSIADQEFWQTMIAKLNNSAATIEGITETRELYCKSASGGRYLHANLSFSQEGEDRILARIFASQAKGFYVDVGAHHPYRFSNTWIFYQRGWRGINIEPDPGAIQEFHLLRPYDINLAVGAAAVAGELPFYVFEEPAYNTFSTTCAAGRQQAGLGGAMATINTPVLPIREILGRHLPTDTPIDFMSIDTEGFEADVLAGMDWEHHRPGILLCESLGKTDLSALMDTPLVATLGAQSYRLFAATVNTLFFKDTRSV